MTTDLATMEESSLELLPPAQLPAQAAMSMLRAHAEMMSMAYDLADKMCRTKLVPTRLQGKPADATAAILYGMELGLTPIQSLQRVIPIHGQPTLEALTMVALLEAKGYTVKTVAESEEFAEVHGWKPGHSPETHEPDAKFRRTIQWATRAGYVPKPSSDRSLQRPEVDDDWVTVTKTFDGRSKKSVVGNMKYITDPQAMLIAKCRTLVCKELAPHVLLGISGSTEELRSEPRYDDEPAAATEQSDTITVEEIIGDAGAQAGASFREKVKPAAKAPDPEPTPEPEPAAEPEGVPADEPVDPEPAPEPDPEPNVPPAAAAPGAPTESTPGRTDRVEQALGNARKTSKARDAYLDLIAALFRDAGLETLDELPTIASSILKTRVQYAATLTDSQLKTIHTSLNAWKTVGTITEMLGRILEAADMKAEEAQQDAEQPPLDADQ